MQARYEAARSWRGGLDRESGGKGMLMTRVYEVMFIVRPDVAEEDADKLIAGFSATVTGGGGVVKSVEKMGRRKLAYMVRKFNDGNYVLLTIEANGPVVLELERRLLFSEPQPRIAMPPFPPPPQPMAS